MRVCVTFSLMFTWSWTKHTTLSSVILENRLPHLTTPSWRLCCRRNWTSVRCYWTLSLWIKGSTPVKPDWLLKAGIWTRLRLAAHVFFFFLWMHLALCFFSQLLKSNLVKSFLKLFSVLKSQRGWPGRTLSCRHIISPIAPIVRRCITLKVAALSSVLCYRFWP